MIIFGTKTNWSISIFNIHWAVSFNNEITEKHYNSKRFSIRPVLQQALLMISKQPPQKLQFMNVEELLNIVVLKENKNDCETWKWNDWVKKI